MIAACKRATAVLGAALALTGCVQSRTQDVTHDTTYHGTIARLFFYGAPDQGNLPSMKRSYDPAIARAFATCGIATRIMRRQNFSAEEQVHLDEAAGQFGADALLITTPIAVEENTMFRQAGLFGNSFYAVSAHRFVWRNRQSVFTRYAPGTDLGKIYAETLFNAMASAGALGPDCHPLTTSAPRNPLSRAVSPARQTQDRAPSAQ